MGQKENSERLRELEILEALVENPEARQADLATRLGVAVGTVNWLLKRLVSKGYVKVKRIGRWRWRYLVTPRGFAEKARLTQRYLQNSMRLYRQTRQQSQRLLSAVLKRGYTKVRLEGDSGNDLVDVCRLTCLEQGIDVVDLGKPERGTLRTTNHEPRTTSHDDVPVLHVDGPELSMDWPKGEAIRGDPDPRKAWLAQAASQRLSEVIARIVEVAQPERIILFGSAARGEMGPGSDLDLLVVKAGAHRRRLAQKIYMNLFGVGQAVDVVVVTPEDIKRYRNSHSLVIKPAMQEGKVVYERDSETISTR